MIAISRNQEVRDSGKKSLVPNSYRLDNFADGKRSCVRNTLVYWFVVFSAAFRIFGKRLVSKMISSRERLPWCLSDPSFFFQCYAKFTAKETLNRHVRTHTGIKPHGCKYCGKTFIQLSQLRAHIFHHTGNLRQHPQFSYRYFQLLTSNLSSPNLVTTITCLLRFMSLFLLTKMVRPGLNSRLKGDP